MKSPRTFLIEASKINRGLGSQRPSRKKMGTLRLCGERLIKGLCNNTKSRAQRSYKFSNGWESLQEQKQWEVAKTQRNRESCVVRATWGNLGNSVENCSQPPVTPQTGARWTNIPNSFSILPPISCPLSKLSQKPEDKETCPSSQHTSTPWGTIQDEDGWTLGLG